MTVQQDTLFNSAVAAASQLAHVKSSSADALEEAFRTSAVATHAAIAGKVSAVALAAANKINGSEYKSDAAVGFHAVTGSFLLLDEEGFEGSARSIQTIVKKVGQVVAKKIITKAKTQVDAAERLAAAIPTEVDIVKELVAAFKKIALVEEARLLGHDLPVEAVAIIESISLSLSNVVLGNVPVPTVVFSREPVAA